MLQDLGKWLVMCAVILFAVGGMLWIGFPFGKLPGDFSFKSGKSEVYLPLATSILLSLAVTALVNLLFWFMKK